MDYLAHTGTNSKKWISFNASRSHVSLGSCHDLEHWLEVGGVAAHGSTAEVFCLAASGSRELVVTGHHPCTNKNSFLIVHLILKQTRVDSVSRCFSPGVVLWPNIPLKKQGSRMLPPMSEPTPMTDPAAARMPPSPPADRWVKIWYLSVLSTYSQ